MSTQPYQSDGGRCHQCTGTVQEFVDRQGLSDLIGFTLMFSIIILGVGLVSVTGVTQLTTLSEAEELNSAERGMTSTAATLEKMNRLGDMNRSFSLALTNSHIWMNSSTLNITRSDGGWNNFYETIEINSLEQRFDQSSRTVSVRYEGGGVFRSDSGFPSYEPSFKCRSDSTGETVAIISVVNLSLEEAGGLSVTNSFDQDLVLDQYSVPNEAPVSSFGRTLAFDARLLRSNENLTKEATGFDYIRVNLSGTATPNLWSNHFDRLDDWEKHSSESDTYQCEVDRVLVRVTTIELSVVTPGFG